jgi:hypothetical protein
MNRMNWKSAGMTFLVAVGVASFAAIAGYLTLEPYFERKVMEVSALHIEERANRQSALFADVLAIEYATGRGFTSRLAAMEGVDVSAEFNWLFPEFGDGTRRSRPELFDGYRTADGDYVYGVGAFISDVDVAPERQRQLIAAYHTVRQHGEANSGHFDNLNFVTPNNDLIIFAPGREDRLEFYRRDAPADFDFQSEELAQIVSPFNNPIGVTRCTRLSRLLYVRDGVALTTGCHFPMRQNGRHIGAFGVTISMQNYLANAIVDAEPNSENMILTRDGDVVAHRDLLFQDVLTPNLVAEAGQSAGAATLSEAIRRDGRVSGVTLTDDGRVLAFARIETPGWYFVITRPVWLIHSRASGVSAMIFLFSFLGIFTQAIVLSFYRWLKRRRRNSSAASGGLARV